MSCTAKCWEPAKCPEHGESMYPFGRDAGQDSWYCCDNYRDAKLNPRHLWSEHDSTRWYTDKDGWEQHERNCERCQENV